MSTQTRITNCLQAAFEPVQLDVVDVSHAHRGHSAALANPEKGHFQVRLITARFEGLSLVARHQAVYQALGELMTTSIHALSLATLTPAEAKNDTHTDV